MPERLSFTATVALDLEAKSADGTARRPTFAIKAYTGAVMQAAGFFSPVIVDLSGLKAARDKIPILLDHESSQIIGQTDVITIDAAGVELTGSITGEDANSQSVLTHARNGFEWQASIGASIVRQEFLKTGEKAVVNGREVSGPLLIARESRLFETSFVAIGADPQTTASVAASSSSLGSLPTGETTMFEKWLEAKGFDPKALSDVQRTYFQSLYDEEIKAAREGPKITESLDQIVAKHEGEIERQNKITAFLDMAMADRPALIPALKRLGEVALENKSKFEEVELQVMRLERTRGHGATMVKGGRQVAQKIIEATVARSCGLKELDKFFDQETLNASDDQFPHGIGLRDLLLLGARENGYQGFLSSDPRSLLEAAFPGRSNPREIRAEGISTLSLPGIMSNIANKFLMVGFNAVESSWRDIAAIGNARDFKQFFSYSFVMNSMFAKVGPAGELEHATASEVAYSNKVDTFGKMFAVTRADIINDDLGALSQVPMRLGRGAAIGLNVLFWTEFLANVGTFYTSGRGNVSTGAGSALSSTGLQAAQLAFAKQTDPNLDPLAISPSILLVPPELEITANELMTSLIINTGGASTQTKVPNRNVWANKYKTVMSRYLSNTNIVGNSTTAWWLIADPMELPLIQVAFLNGRQEPVVESADADFNVLGIQFRGYYDCGVAKQEYRASVRSAGT